MNKSAHAPKLQPSAPYQSHIAYNTSVGKTDVYGTGRSTVAAVYPGGIPPRTGGFHRSPQAKVYLEAHRAWSVRSPYLSTGWKYTQFYTEKQVILSCVKVNKIEVTGFGILHVSDAVRAFANRAK